MGLLGYMGLKRPHLTEKEELNPWRGKQYKQESSLLVAYLLHTSVKFGFLWQFT